MLPNFKSADDVVYWMTECTLATVEHLHSLKRKSKSEVQRQISIAQGGINHIKSLDRPLSNRVREVIRWHESDVHKWYESLVG